MFEIRELSSDDGDFFEIDPHNHLDLNFQTVLKSGKRIRLVVTMIELAKGLDFDTVTLSKIIDSIPTLIVWVASADVVVVINGNDGRRRILKNRGA